jgi:hypothetical protein
MTASLPFFASGRRYHYGLSSIEPNDAGDELDGGQEVARGLLIASGDRTKLLDLGEEVFDQMACSTELPVLVAQRGPIGPRWNHGTCRHMMVATDAALSQSTKDRDRPMVLMRLSISAAGTRLAPHGFVHPSIDASGTTGASLAIALNAYRA